MKKTLIQVLLLSVMLSTSFIGMPEAQTQTVEENIALYKKVTVDPAPNSNDTPDHDPQQITDGIYASTKAQWSEEHQTTSLWVQKGTVGWVRKKPVIITIDLGEVQPISGLIYSTAGGTAGVSWPKYIYIATSDDGKVWHYAGELAQLSRKNGTPPAQGYANFRYITRDLKTHGRYISLGIMEEVFVFTDEIEVLRGDDALLNQSAGREIPEMSIFFAHETNTAAARSRQDADITAIRNLIAQSDIPTARKSTFIAQLDKVAAATENMPQLPIDFKTIIPLTDIHRDILAVHGEALAAQGFKPLTVWKKHRYAWLPLVNVPDKKQTPELHISMLKNQFRSDAILLTNASDKPMTVQVALNNAPPGAQDGWLTLNSAIWTDTYEGIPVQDALMPMARDKGDLYMQIPAGVTGKLWVTIDSSKIPTGVYKSTFVINTGNQSHQKISIPFNMDISKIAMPTPRLSLTMWDDLNNDVSHAITEKNRQAAIALMRSHFVDTPGAGPRALPFPKESDFNDRNELVGKLDFSNFDTWLMRWPGARNYFIFRNTQGSDTFAGTKMGTDAFNQRVGNWIKAFEAHVISKGLKPSQIIINFVDESRSDQSDLYLVGWGRPTKAAAPEIRLFTDPIWKNPGKAKSLEAVTINDIITPHPSWDNDYYVKIAHQHNKDLWLYNCPGLGRTGDPQLGYRQMAWRVFAAGGKGEGFWAFGDTGKIPTSWDEYRIQGRSYAPAFIDTDMVYNSLHWDAVREGVEDFEELSMLKDAIAKLNNATLKAQAQKVLEEAIAAATALKPVGDLDNDAGFYDWDKNHDPTTVDAQLTKVRNMLEQIDR